MKRPPVVNAAPPSQQEVPPHQGLSGKEAITIPADVLSSWQNIVDTVAEMVQAPVSLITRTGGGHREIVRAGAAAQHPYRPGDHHFLEGSYCEEVIKSKQPLLVSDGAGDGRWTNNPDLRQGMVSYLGLPLLWPDGAAFGTLCVLNRRAGCYTGRHEGMMGKFRELVETQLALLHKNSAEKNNLENILDSLAHGVIAHDLNRRIQFFNRAAEEITAYRREDVLGRDCHEVFGGPFCGGRCSFQEGTPLFTENLYYPLNIINKNGEARRIEMVVTSRFNGSGTTVGVIASFRDVTDLISLRIQAGELKSFAGIIGRDRRMLEIYRQIRNLATNDYPVCITGETGTGKELVAQAIHNESRRGGGPFVPVNCAALPEGVLESELFGHVKGAFTGAVRDKKGRFELAHGGTLFLDEVGDLPPVVQAKLLRVLQEKKFERVGDEKTASVDVRIISATNRDLKRMVGRGTFRDDLYYRLTVVPLEVPPLRKRKGDIPLLVDHFLEKAREEGQAGAGISPEAMKVITDYPWPGNVRELQSAVRFALVTARGRTVEVGHLPLELRQWDNARPARGPSRKLDVESVQTALLQSGGNKARAARSLGVGRATLYRFLADFVDVS